MGLNFNDINGAAKKGGEFYKFKDGVQRFRIVGDVLPRYLYWVKNSKGNSFPFECLGFDRDLEKFTNIEKDHVQENVTVYDPKTKKDEPIRCSWAYACQVIDLEDGGKLKIMNLKKKMFQAIISSARKLGDPTSFDEGYDIVVERQKTGPLAYNVEYNLDIVTMMQAGKRPLTDEELELVAELKPMAELIPRPTADEQKAALEKHLAGEDEEAEDDSTTDTSAIDDLENA